MDWDCGWGRPRVVSVGQALRMTLAHLRRNCTYEELGERYGIAVSTAWSYVHTMIDFLARLLGCDDADLPDLVAGRVCLIDGTLVPTFRWRHRDDLYSGHHHRYGMNLQVIADLHGRLVTVSRIFPGARHDSWCFEQTGWTKILAVSGGGVGDAGYQGCQELTTPIKKKPGVKRLEHDIEFNRGVAKIRVGVEHAIGHLKNWRILAGRYRGELHRIDTAIQAVAGLQILNEECSGRRLDFRSSISRSVSE